MLKEQQVPHRLRPSAMEKQTKMNDGVLRWAGGSVTRKPTAVSPSTHCPQPITSTSVDFVADDCFNGVPANVSQGGQVSEYKTSLQSHDQERGKAGPSYALRTRVHTHKHMNACMPRLTRPRFLTESVNYVYVNLLKRKAQ